MEKALSQLEHISPISNGLLICLNRYSFIIYMASPGGTLTGLVDLLLDELALLDPFADVLTGLLGVGNLVDE